MSWRAWHALNPDKNSGIETYGFNTTRAPPAVPELREFQQDVIGLLKKVKFRRVNSDFQRMMKKDLNDIIKGDKVVVSADKTNNLYKLEVDAYRKSMAEEVTASYKKVGRRGIEKTNKEAAKLVSKLDIEDRVDVFAESEPFVLVKDHKEGFPARVKNRLVNTAKSSVCRISQQILAKINKEVKTKTGLSQWTNTEDAIEWFKDLQSKQRLKFIKFDIVNFYPSISKKTFEKAIKFAQKFTVISKDEVELLIHCREAYLCYEGDIWAKKDNPKFDVTIGAWDGAEVAELVGLMIMDEVEKILPTSGLYRDDGLAVTQKSGPETARVEKRLHKLFGDFDLKVTTEAGLVETDFLDVVFNLATDSFRPFRKPNDKPLYIHVESSHPPNIIKALPSMIETRLSAISSSETDFNGGKGDYKEALRSAGYKDVELKFSQENKRSGTKRRRKICWFNPPWASNVDGNIAGWFNSLVRKHFKKGTLMGKLFNNNNLRVSYSCTRNVHALIAANNRRLLNSAGQVGPVRRCNCRKGTSCPAGGNCLEEGVVYEATITSANTDKKVYIGSSATSLKLRMSNHACDFRLRTREHNTTMSTYVWGLKDKGEIPLVTYRILKKARPYSPISRKCSLCTAEKVLIAKGDEAIMLNKKSEISNKCRHRNKHLLASVLDKG